MAKVTQRQRFLGTLLGGRVDRFPFFDLEPAEETLRRWHREGLSRWKSFTKHFHLEPHYSAGLMLRSYPFFGKASDLLQDPSSFERHYNPDQKSRYGRGFEKRCRRLHEKGKVVYTDASGGGLLQMLGVGDWGSLTNACMAIMEKPDAVEALVRRTTDFYCVCLERLLSRVSVDYASFYEPIAANTGPVISPAMFKRFAIPGYRKVIDLLEKFQVPLRVLCTTGGDLSSLMPFLINAGINGLWLSNIRSAGMEYRTLRREFGPEIALIGGIDTSALAENERAIRDTIHETVPALLEKGRYLPCLDDRPRPNIPFSHYRLYRQCLNEIARKG